jgi:hypothetical protein
MTTNKLINAEHLLKASQESFGNQSNMSACCMIASTVALQRDNGR